MNNLSWLLSVAKPYLPLILVSLVGSAIQSAGAAYIALLIKKVVDNVFILKNQSELLLYTSLLLLGAVVMELGFFISSFSLSYASEKLVNTLRNNVYGKLLKVPLNYFLYTHSGDLISRIVSDIESFKQVFSEYVPKVLREPFVIVALLGVLIYRDFTLTLFVLLLFPTMALLTKYFSEKKKKHLRNQRKNVSLLTETLTETFRGIENIKVFLAEKFFTERFKVFSERLFKSSVKIDLYVIGNTAINYLFGYFAVGLILLAGGYRIVQGSITTGDFVSFLTALFMIQKPIMDLQKAIMNLRGSAPVFERIRELLNLPEDKGGKEVFEGLKEKISFVNVSVKAGDKYILKDVNLEVRKGEKLGIKGHTGSGKSTFVRIIPRLVEYEGSVLIDGLELSSFDIASLRKRIGFLSQEIVIFKGSVRENLLIANPEADEREMIRALELARCDFVLGDPKGLDKEIEEGGRNLSGGERQRLAIARVILKNPEIIILDEATSALDERTEREVMDNLFKHFYDRTFFIVAHKPYSLSKCDRVVEFENGVLKEVSHVP
ncbi:ABC transporter ATP-binding protein [Aquifex pyrophilus]